MKKVLLIALLAFCVCRCSKVVQRDLSPAPDRWPEKQITQTHLDEITAPKGLE